MLEHLVLGQVEVGAGERAHRTAWASLKNVTGKRGPLRARGPLNEPTKPELYDIAGDREIRDRSKMSKEALRRAATGRTGRRVDGPPHLFVTSMLVARTYGLPAKGSRRGPASASPP